MSVLTDNLARWDKVTLIRVTAATAAAQKLLTNKSRYVAVEKRTGVPWFVIAVIHNRESSGSFAGVLHNGERIIGTGRKTRLVPAGRGPFKSWEEAAIDALVNCHPYAGRNTDWSVGGTLALLERYNGLGYYNRGLPSPYVWAGTDQYSRGKYVRDGVFDPHYVDQQLGCAALLLAMRRLDSSVILGSPPSAQRQPPVTSPRSLWEVIVNIISKLFRRV